MKHKLTFLAFLLAMLAIPHHAIAEYDFSAVAPTGQTLYYTITGSNEVSVTYPSSNYYQPYGGFSEPTGDLSIPSTVTNGGTTYSVTSIGERTFYGCSGLTSLTIPNSVTSIVDGAFEGFSRELTSIVVSSGNTVYDSRENCNAIIETASNTLICGCANTTIPSSVTAIGNFAFYSCYGLTSLTLSNSIIWIGISAFDGCSGLTSLTIPNSVTSIGAGAFSGCSGLTSLTIPNSVTRIGASAFNGCSGLTSLTIGSSVTIIDNYAFFGCSGLTFIMVENGNTVYDSRENCNAIIETHTNTLITGCMSTSIPNSVTSIGERAFYDCIGLTSLTIPNSVTSIGDYAFLDCSELTSLTIPNSVTSIGASAFYDCIGLTSLTIGNSVTSIGDDAFRNCRSLTSLTIPNSVTSIGASAFYDCIGLTSLTIGNSVTSIVGGAFQGCSDLTEIDCLCTTPPTLGENVFSDFTNTIPVNIPCGSTASYQSEWSHFSNFNEVFSPYTLDVYSSDDAMGSASITTLPNCDDNTGVIEATANAGYHFDHWSDGTTENPYTVQLTDNTTLIAYFAINTGIEEMDDSGIRVYAKDNQILIDAAVGETVNVYTIDGRTIATLPKATEHVAIPVTTAGVYLVKIGNHPARKVVVIW